MSYLTNLVLVAALIAPVSASAQAPAGRQLIYSRIEGNAGSVAGPHLGVAAILKERHELGLAAAMYLHPVQEVPADLECGCIHGIGYDGMSGFSATYAYLLYPGKGQQFWRIALRGGIIAGTGKRTYGFRPISSQGPYDANYDWDIEHRFSVGLVLRPTVDLAINRVFGFSAGPYAMFSNEFMGGGVTFGVMIGRVSRSGLHQRVHAWKRRVRPASGHR